MNYEEAIDYLYNRLPAFEKSGAGDYKPGLETARSLSEMFGNPEKRLKTVHIAGTNGKGTTAHTLAAILQSAGYKTGLYTSPHLIDFRERVRIDGKMIPREKVVDFVERYLSRKDDSISPTFFELTTIMAFEYFAEEGVDAAIIETGLGGRLDTTNIISPMVSVITNISLDHTSLLGDTLQQIASEKAGIIKPGVPVVIGPDCEQREVFKEKARSVDAPLIVSHNVDAICRHDGSWLYYSDGWFRGSMKGDWQRFNAATILETVEILRHCGYNIEREALERGFSEVESLTGLRGRWTVVGKDPLTIYDTGHNPGAWKWLAPQLEKSPGTKHIVIGFVADKDVTTILSMMPQNAVYYFTQPHCHRALSAKALQGLAIDCSLNGEVYGSVDEALASARKNATAADTIFIGGSNYLISELTL